MGGERFSVDAESVGVRCYQQKPGAVLSNDGVAKQS